MTPLIEALVATLGRPRELSAQVLNHLSGTYSVDRDAVGPFLVNELPGLEDYQIDLALSSLFTPTLHDQAGFADLLGRDSFPQEQWPALIQQLAARPTRAQLVTSDGQVHPVPLREVTLERFVHRLRLDGTIPESVFQLISHLPPAADRPLLKAVARHAIWENDARRQILVRYLTSSLMGDSAVIRTAEPALSRMPAGGAPGAPGSTDNGIYRLDDVLELLRLVETYQPRDVADLLAHIPHWQEVIRQQIEVAGNPKPFFNERVQELHGGGRDQRRQDNARISAKENERAFLERLQQVLVP